MAWGKFALASSLRNVIKLSVSLGLDIVVDNCAICRNHIMD